MNLGLSLGLTTGGRRDGGTPAPSPSLTMSQYENYGYWPGQDESGTAPYSYSISSGSLPTGLSVSQNTGAITGQVTAAAGSYPVTLRRTDRAGVNVDTALTLVVTAPIAFALSQLPAGSYTDYDPNVGITLNGGNVDTWSPKVGSGTFTTADAAARPAVVADYFGTGKPAISSNGAATGNRMTGGPALPERPWHFMIAARGTGNQEGTATPKVVLSFGRASDGKNGGIALQRVTNDASQNQIYCITPGSGNVGGGVAGTFAASVPHLLTHTFRRQVDNNSTLYVGGSSVSTGGMASTGTSTEYSLFGGGTSGAKAKMFLGRFIAVESSQLPGDDPQSCNRWVIEGHLAGEYGLQSDLRADHPFKSRTPSAVDWKAYSQHVSLWGNSLGAGTVGQIGAIWGSSAGGFAVYQGGIGGSNSSQIKTRFDSGIDDGGSGQTNSGWATSIQRNRMVIFFEIFENDDSAGISDATRKQNLADMVAAVETAQGVAAGQAKNLIVGGRWKGNGNIAPYASQISFNEYLRTTYPNYFCDVWRGLVNLGAPGAAYADATAYAADRIPAALRIDLSDTIHLNTAGYQEAARVLLQYATTRRVR